MNEGDHLTIMLSSRQALFKVPVILAISMFVSIGCTKSENEAPPAAPPDPAPPPTPVTPHAPVEAPVEKLLEDLVGIEKEVQEENFTLEGSSWRLGEFTYTFQNGGHAIVGGGHFNELSEAGVPGRYTVKGEDITITVMSRRYKARREGGTLYIGDRKAERIVQETAESEP